MIRPVAALALVAALLELVPLHVDMRRAALLRRMGLQPS